MNKNEVETLEFEINSKKFCFRTNLRRPENGFGSYWSGLKTGVKNDIFWSKIGSGFGEPGHTHQEFLGVQPPTHPPPPPSPPLPNRSSESLDVSMVD